MRTAPDLQGYFGMGKINFPCFEYERTKAGGVRRFVSKYQDISWSHVKINDKDRSGASRVGIGIALPGEYFS